MISINILIIFPFWNRVLCFALTTKGYNNHTGIVFDKHSDFLYIVRGPNTWMIKEIYVAIIRFVIRLDGKFKSILIDDVCTGHQSELVKGYLYNAGFEYTSVPGGGTGLFFFLCIIQLRWLSE